MARMRGARRRTASGVCEALGTSVRALRRARKLTQEAFAARAGLHVTYVSGIERGRRNPTLNVLVDLAEALGISIAELLRGVRR